MAGNFPAATHSGSFASDGRIVRVLRARLLPHRACALALPPAIHGNIQKTMQNYHRHIYSALHAHFMYNAGIVLYHCRILGYYITFLAAFSGKIHKKGERITW